MSNVYIGFSTVNKTKPPFKLYDIEVVKQDIINHFHTRRGERVMMPEFGSVIHDLLMNPFDDITRSEILEDARNIIDQEPRVELVEMNTVSTEHTFRLEIELIFKPQETAEILFVEFEKKDSEAF